MNEQQAQQARKQEMLRRHRCLRSLEQYLPDSKRQKTLFSEPTSSKRRPERLPQQVQPPILLLPPALPLQDAQPQPQPPEEFIVDLTEDVPLVSVVPDYDRKKRELLSDYTWKKEELLSNSCMEYWLSEHYDLMIVRHRSIEIDVRKFKTLAPNHYLCDAIIDCHFQMLRKAMNKPVERELLKAFRKGASVLSTMKLEVLVYSAQFISKIFTRNGRNSYEYCTWLPNLSIMTYNYLLITNFDRWLRTLPFTLSR